ncbi:MAG: alpha/beta fold hydrolase [Caldilineaceae bacterium]
MILEPWPEVFNTCMDPNNPSKSRCWPQVINDKAMRPYFARVRQMMAIEKYIDRDDLAAGVTTHDPLLEGSLFYGAEQGTDPVTGQPLRDYRGRTFAERPPLPKARYLRDALDYIQTVEEQPAQHATQGDWVQMRNGNYQPHPGAKGEFHKAPVAINLTLVEDGQPNAAGVPQRKCTLCGDCVTGCNVGAKNMLTMNYLPLAVKQGAAIFTQVEVQSIHPSERPTYRYCLQVLRREVKGGKLQSSTVRVYTRMLILSAGVFGTVKLLLNAQQRGEMRFSTQLGQRFSGNADALAVSYNGKRRLNSIGYGRHGSTPWEVGPTITAMADFRRVPGRHHLVQDAAFPSPLVEATRRLFAAPNLWKTDGRVWRDWLRQDLSSKAEGALNHSQVWLSMGHDAAAGELYCDRKGNLRLTWLGSGAQQVHAATRKTFQILSRLVGASHIANPRDQRWFIKRAPTPITVHPLGGGCMAEDIEHGVTDHAGRLFHPEGGVYAGLYISDGSLCDASVGANPSLTIAALAERAAEQIIQDDLPRLIGQQGHPQEKRNELKQNGLLLADSLPQELHSPHRTHRPVPTSRRQPQSAVAQRLPTFSRANWVTIIELLLLVVALNVVIRFSGTAMAAMKGDVKPAPSSPTLDLSEVSTVVPGLQLGFLPVTSVKANAPGPMRVGVLTPDQPLADILFIHGHADRLDNHGPLFTAWRAAGYRVISFDLPSHGESNILPIDLYSFADLFTLVRLVEASTREDENRPLVIAGWSFGGLVATRLAQQPADLAAFGRPPQGMILFTPAVVPYPFAGGDGIARISTLTHQPNPPVAGPPSPAAPAQNPLFAGRLLYEAWQAGREQLSSTFPVLVITAGESEDWYVNTPAVQAWAAEQKNNGANLHLFQCHGARHAIDNEAFPIGPAVRQLAVAFATTVVEGSPLSTTDGPCMPSIQAD